MPILNGLEVRHRAAELAPTGPADTADGGRRYAQRHIVWLSEQTGIPAGTIHNATRENNPQGVTLVRVYDIAHALRRDGEDVRGVVAAITVGDVSLPGEHHSAAGAA